MLKLLLRRLYLSQMHCRLQYQFKTGTWETLEPAGLVVDNVGLWHLSENKNVVHISKFLAYRAI